MSLTLSTIVRGCPHLPILPRTTPDSQIPRTCLTEHQTKSRLIKPLKILLRHEPRLRHPRIKINQAISRNPRPFIFSLFAPYRSPLLRIRAGADLPIHLSPGPLRLTTSLRNIHTCPGKSQKANIPIINRDKNSTKIPPPCTSKPPSTSYHCTTELAQVRPPPKTMSNT
jgi:hypothetical protein